jgi:hypothetical protein
MRAPVPHEGVGKEALMGTHLKQLCCMRDEGRLLETGRQGRFQTILSCCGQKPWGRELSAEVKLAPGTSDVTALLGLPLRPAGASLLQPGGGHPSRFRTVVLRAGALPGLAKGLEPLERTVLRPFFYANLRYTRAPCAYKREGVRASPCFQ